jgi:hypothetical protein
MARKIAEVRMHWNHFFDGLNASSQDFFKAVEEAVKRRNLPDIKFERVDYREGGIFSAKREYLRIEHSEHLFDVCAAPFGTGFFFSWWQSDPAPSGLWGIIMKIPVLGPWSQALFKPMTFYRKDTTLMASGAIGSSIQEVLETITKANGMRSLTEEERKPIMKDLFGR